MNAVSNDILNLIVLEYSSKQGQFHKHTLGQALDGNLQMIILGKRSEGDYIPVGIFRTDDEAVAARNGIIQLILEEQKRKGSVSKSAELE